MMNETLKNELSTHLRVINGRDNFIKKWERGQENKIKSFGSGWNGQDEIQKLIHLKAKNYLDKKKFDFGNELKGRNRWGDRIIWENSFLKVRKFKQHSFYNVNFINENGVNEFLPDGFRKCVGIIETKLERIYKLKPEFKGAIKLNKSNKFNLVYNTELKEDKVIKIILGNENKYRNSNISVELEGDSHIYSEEWAYHNTRIFKKILKLMNKFERYLKDITEARERLRNEALEFVNHEFDKILILESFKENE